MANSSKNVYSATMIRLNYTQGLHRIPQNLQNTSTTVEVIFGEWMKEAGIEKDFTYHSSRLTTATLAITAGADISAVKEMLGHGSVTSTEVYAKVSLDKKIQAVNLTDGVFG